MCRTNSPLTTGEDNEVTIGRYTREPLSPESPLPRPLQSADQPPPRPPKQNGVDIYRTFEGSGVQREGEQATSQLAGNKRHQGKIKFKVLDSTHVGDYERSPTYLCSSQVVLEDISPDRTAGVGMQLHAPTDKYRGNYERDPNYMSQLAARRLLTCQIPPPTEILGHSAAHNGNGDIKNGSKYRGNYERDPVYMLRLLEMGEVAPPSVHTGPSMQSSIQPSSSPGSEHTSALDNSLGPHHNAS